MTFTRRYSIADGKEGDIEGRGKVQGQDQEEQRGHTLQEEDKQSED